MKRKNTDWILLIGVLIYLFIITIPLAGALAQQTGKIDGSIGLRQISLLGNSLKLGITVTMIDLLLGFFCAIYISNSKKLTGWKKYYFVAMMPIPFYIYALSWMYMLKLLAFVCPEIIRYSVSGIGACIFVETLAYFPVATLFLLIGIDNIDADRVRMASVYGSDNKVVWQVIVQSIIPYASAAAGLICTLSMTEFSVPSMFQYNTYALDIFSVYSRTGSALTAYIQCVPLILSLVIPIIWLVRNINQFGIKANKKEKYLLKTTGVIGAMGKIAFSVSLLQIFVPIIVFLITAGGVQNVYFGWKMVADELNTSFWTSFFCAAICILLSSIPSMFLKRHLTGVPGVILYTMAIPGAIQAMGLLKVINMVGLISFEKSIWMTSLGCALKMAPFVILWFCVARMRVDTHTIEMAEIYAINKFEPIKVRIHIFMPAYIAGFGIAFFLAFAEESIPLILMAPGKETITVKIYNYLHYGASDYVSAFSIVVILFIFCIEITMILIYKVLKGMKVR